MSRMIRCIEGHVFDADNHAKCPSCGWVPKKSAKKPKRAEDSGASFGQTVSETFAGIIGTVEHGLGAVGIKNNPGLAAGIVYAGVILLLVTGASALPGSFWPGNWGKTTEASLVPGATEKTDKDKKDRSAGKSPAATDIPATPPLLPTPPEKKKSASNDPPGADSNPGAPADDPAPSSEKRRRQYQQPHIQVPHDVRRLLHRIF